MRMTQANPTQPGRVLIKVLDPQAPYKIQLTVRDGAAFAYLMSDTRFKNKSEEQLLSALFNEFKTQIIEIERYSALGKCSDGPKGQPASQIFNEDGVMILQRRFCEGKLQDSKTGEPAVLEYDGNRILRVKEHHKGSDVCEGDQDEPSVTTYAPDGSLQSEERFKDGLYNDGNDGQPAMVMYNRKNQAMFTEHFFCGLLNDSVRGEPASKEFNEAGQLVQAARYRMGEELHELDADEIAAYNAALRAAQNNNTPQGPKRPPSLPGPKP